MSLSAYALLGVFTALSLAAGAVAWWLIDSGPWWRGLVPAAAAFGVLYLVGHRLGWTLGPTVSLFGFDVALPWEIGLALAAAGITAGILRALA